MRFPITRGQSDPDDGRSEVCASCYFWKPWFTGDTGPVVKAVGRLMGMEDTGRGECRRHSPTGSNRWNWTDGNDWCGDYEQKPEPREDTQ